MGSTKKPSEQRGLFSRLPDDPVYWENLSTRIADDAAPTLDQLREENNQWWSVPARFSTALAIGASAAVIAAILLLPGGGSGDTVPASPNMYGLAPAGPLAESLLTPEAPPSLEMLMALRHSERDR